MPRFAVAIIAVVLLVSGTFNAHAAANEDAVAVVIGNSNYTADRIPKVDYAHRDAAAFKRYLIDILGYREGNIIDLRDATQAQMEAALGNDRTHEGTLWQYVRPEGSDVTVFYSGHGVPGLKSKRGYLLPVDADPNKPEINGYPVDTLYANLAKLPARSVTVYLDACFSGDSPKGMLINATSGITITPRLPKQQNRLTILTAATGDQVASWDLEKRHGLFTEHLLAALYGAADTPRYGAADGNVTLGEVRKYLSRNMSYAAKRTYGRIQHATINGGEDVVLAALGANHPKRPVLDIGSTQAVALTPVKTPRPKPNDLHLTKEIINSWWDGPKNYQTEKVFCEKLIKVVEVHPSSGESAFIAVCAVNRSHIEGFDAFLIIRPKFKEAKEFSSLRGSGSIHQVVDLDNDGISEIVLSSGETHQGFHHAEIQIIGINGWNADVIYQRNIEDCTGNSSYRYVKDCAFGEPTEISFIFEDLDGDQVLDLVETVNYFVKFKDMSIDEAVKRFGQNWWEVGIALEEATRVNHYLFKNRVFIPYRLN